MLNEKYFCINIYRPSKLNHKLDNVLYYTDKNVLQRIVYLIYNYSYNWTIGIFLVTSPLHVWLVELDSLRGTQVVL